jgi:hypothetical protein
MDDSGIRSSITLVIRQETGELPATVLCQQDGEFEFDEFGVEESGDYAQDQQGSVSLGRTGMMSVMIVKLMGGFSLL